MPSESAAPASPELRSRIRDATPELSPSERKVAEVLSADPEAIAFGTVAEVARLAGTSGPSVLRLARRLGFAGFVELQDTVREELRHRLRPAVRRIRSAAKGDPLARALEVESANLRDTLAAADPRAFARAAALLADPKRRVFVLASEQCRTVGERLCTELQLLRDDVYALEGSPFRMATLVARVARGDVLAVLDFRRHERWVLEWSARAQARGALRIAITNHDLSPLNDGARHAFVVAAAASGPFDSLIGATALAQAFVAAVAERLRPRVVRRLDTLESHWRETDVLTED